MSDTPGNGADSGADEQQQPPLTVNGQYIKDLSFESPNSPGILAEMQNQQPDVNISVNVTTAKLSGGDTPDNLHEIVLELNAELKLKEKVGFILELKYAGVFTLNVPEEHLNAFMLIECPRLLFPFARQIIADTTQSGGFMPLTLQPIDFAAMYQANALNNAKDTTDALSAEVEKISEKKSDA